VEVVAHEKELLEKFVETVQSENPDVILGYNSDSFDFPYICDRAAKLGVPLKLGIDGSSPKFTRIGFSNSAMIRAGFTLTFTPIPAVICIWPITPWSMFTWNYLGRGNWTSLEMRSTFIGMKEAGDWKLYSITP
jgi:DNA polymerase elongation subunit (family B)